MSRTRNWCFTIFTEDGDGEASAHYDPNTIDWLSATPQVRYVVAGLEVAPTSGRLHWQGYIELQHPATLVSCKNSLGTDKAHLEIRRGTRNQAIAYCLKQDSAAQGEPEGNEPKIIFTWGDDNPQGTDDIYDEVLCQTDVNTAIQFIKRVRPRDYCIFGQQLHTNLERHFTKPKAYDRGTRQYNLPFLPDHVLETKAIYINGPAGSGKTRWSADHFENPLLVSHKDDLKRLAKGSYNGIIFDDFNISHWPIGAVIHLCDLEWDRSIDVKHGTVTIPAQMPRIFTNNLSFDEWCPSGLTEEQKNALRRRIHVINVHVRLFE
ncbi:replication-associated protein [Spider associated circular virus 3]|uniref:replication-associated protein n=1 Tax=Spider associated circular virus 3 TaxID=2293304 RepID=UPI000E335C4D|nr:replication-associated protein [Spider associated circular virus 3]AXL65938.1 replication-associated protein [Spider associated circular virus 3]